MSKPQTNDAPPNESKFKRHGGEETEECAWRIGRCCSTNAAGIDVGAREMFVAVPPGRDNIPVRVFASFTRRSPALGRLAGALPRDHGGLGAHWGLLDSPVRTIGTTRHSSLPGECTSHEERTGTTHGLARVPMAAIPELRDPPIKAADEIIRSRRRDHPQIVGRQLAVGASVHPSTIT